MTCALCRCSPQHIELRRQTQSKLAPGNCWQTAVACVLGVSADELPDQVEIEREDRSYWNLLNAYLKKHHGSIYSELYDWQFSAIEIRDPGLHIMVGPTVRTPDKGTFHAIVGRRGEPFWDPHPSRAGLTKVDRWGIVSKATEQILRDEAERIASSELDSWLRKNLTCICPKCQVADVATQDLPKEATA
jgi:hypothetical protein